MKWSRHRLRSYGYAVGFIVIAAGLDCEAQVARGDLLVGSSFTSENAGHPLSAWSVAQDEHTRTVFAGTAEGLLEFDGENWRKIPAPLSFIRGLRFDTEGRLWAGSFGDIGYFPRTNSGHLGDYVSIAGQLPSEWKLSKTVWDCFTGDGGMFFVTEQALFHWRNGTVRAWALPSSHHLVAFEFEGNVWVHRRESGLYRVSSEGPELQYIASALPDRGIHKLLRARSGLVSVSSQGIRRIGEPTTSIAPETTDAFLRNHFVASVDTLWDGSYAIGTLKGIAILNGDFEITRIISSADGLPSPTINRAHSDAEGNLWLATQAGFYRVPSGDDLLP